MNYLEAKAIYERHKADLCGRPHVEGCGLSRTLSGQYFVRVYVVRFGISDNDRLPAEVEGLPVIQDPVGEIVIGEIVSGGGKAWETGD